MNIYLLIIIALAYIEIAIISIRIFSYNCYFYYEKFEYTPLRVLAGILWPITYLVLGVLTLIELLTNDKSYKNDKK